MEPMPVVEAAKPFRHFSNAELMNDPPAAPRAAVMVVHGIGQQRKFETLSDVVSGLAAAAGMTGQPQARNIVVGDERLSRMEMELADGRRVDVYEAYWSPITEGQTTLRDVMTFLKNAAWNGLRNSGKEFRRWVFGAHRTFVGGRATKVLLVLALGVLWSLVFLNTIIVAFGAMRFTRSGPSYLNSPDAINDLTATVLMLIAVFIGFGLVYGAAERQKKAGKELLVSRLGLWYFVATTMYTLMAGLVMLATIFFYRKNFPAVGRFAGLVATWTGALLLAAAALICLLAIARSRAKVRDLLSVLIALVLAVSILLIAVNRRDATVLEEGFPQAQASIFDAVGSPLTKVPFASAALAFLMDRWLAIWALLALVSARIRNVLVQYVGDVAAYVTPSSLDRFDTIRERIKACVYQTANAIYRAGDDNGQLLYDSVVIAGHSLGSVAAYDCLNRMLNDDDHSGRKLRVLDRTKGLITFGSPLDKTAFIFETNIDKNSANRAALAATVQPLINDPKTKVIPWTNVYSKWDIISGKLNFYDDPAQPNRVKNIADLDAVTPVGAHNEYWNNPTVWQQLNGCLPKPSGPRLHP